MRAPLHGNFIRLASFLSFSGLQRVDGEAGRTINSYNLWTRRHGGSRTATSTMLTRQTLLGPSGASSLQTSQHSADSGVEMLERDGSHNTPPRHFGDFQEIPHYDNPVRYLPDSLQTQRGDVEHAQSNFRRIRSVSAENLPKLMAKHRQWGELESAAENGAHAQDSPAGLWWMEDGSSVFSSESNSGRRAGSFRERGRRVVSQGGESIYDRPRAGPSVPGLAVRALSSSGHHTHSLTRPLSHPYAQAEGGEATLEYCV